MFREFDLLFSMNSSKRSMYANIFVRFQMHSQMFTEQVNTVMSRQNVSMYSLKVVDLNSRVPTTEAKNKSMQIKTTTIRLLSGPLGGG